MLVIVYVMVLKMISNCINKPNPTHRKKQYNCEGMTGNTREHTHTFKHKDTGGMQKCNRNAAVFCLYFTYFTCTRQIQSFSQILRFLHGIRAPRVFFPRTYKEGELTWFDEPKKKVFQSCIIPSFAHED